MTLTTGNAYADGSKHRGWLVGHFIEPESSPLNSTDVEVKWAEHPAGDERAGWTDASTEVRTTFVLLLKGDFVVRFPDGDAPLKRAGDFVVFPPGTAHSWRAVTDSVVMTVRWPSVA